MADDSRTKRLHNLKMLGECCLYIALPILLSTGIGMIFGAGSGFIALIVLGNLSLFVMAGSTGFHLVEIVILFCGPFSLVMFILYPVFLHAHKKAQSTTCLTNMKRLETGTLLYAQDYDNVLPYDAVGFKPLISSHVQDRAAFTCPLDPPTANSYTFNSNLANVSKHNITSLAQTILIYEGKTEKLAYRHEGRATVGFADGHCRIVGPDKASTLEWTVSAGLEPRAEMVSPPSRTPIHPRP